MFESAAPRSRVKHSTTEPKRYQAISVIGSLRGLRKFGIFIRLELYNTDAMLQATNISANVAPGYPSISRALSSHN